MTAPYIVALVVCVVAFTSMLVALWFADEEDDA